MAGDVKGDLDAYDDINITPMVDLTFVLLIIFIIMTTAAVQGIKVELPKASSQPSLGESKTKAISISADGTVYLDTYPVSMGELESQLSGFYAADPSLPVIIKGDAKVNYAAVIEVLDLVGRIGITQIGLVTQKQAK
ncbi:MAG: biopolymer transporter ExbD [Gammaproteobacteria bacterium]|nr:biopolymer transporter ExbD [Gammaproteobacteria bacterium]